MAEHACESSIAGPRCTVAFWHSKALSLSATACLQAPAGSSSGEDSDAEPEDDVDFDNSEEYASRKQESRATGMASRRSGRKRKAGPSEGVVSLKQSQPACA